MCPTSTVLATSAPDLFYTLNVYSKRLSLCTTSYVCTAGGYSVLRELMPAWLAAEGGGILEMQSALSFISCGLGQVTSLLRALFLICKFGEPWCIYRDVWELLIKPVYNIWQDFDVSSNSQAALRSIFLGKFSMFLRPLLLVLRLWTPQASLLASLAELHLPWLEVGITYTGLSHCLRLVPFIFTLLSRT